MSTVCKCPIDFCYLLHVHVYTYFFVLVYILQHEIKQELILSNYITIKQVQNIFVGICHACQNKSHFVIRTNYRP